MPLLERAFGDLRQKVMPVSLEPDTGLIEAGRRSVAMLSRMQSGGDDVRRIVNAGCLN
jgi:hypothetical protein